jgi:hypothetical protein
MQILTTNNSVKGQRAEFYQHPPVVKFPNAKAYVM